LTRQKVPTLDRDEVASAEGAMRGAYVLWESEGTNGAPDLILIATGSEVAVALDAAKRLGEEEQAHVRVVSMPCWELFQEQSQDYRDEVLPPEVKARLSVEAGVTLGWKQWVGDEGEVLAIDRFGASAPGTEVLERLGFNVDNVVSHAAAFLQRVS
jgi:transketolase